MLRKSVEHRVVTGSRAERRGDSRDAFTDRFSAGMKYCNPPHLISVLFFLLAKSSVFNKSHPVRKYECLFASGASSHRLRMNGFLYSGPEQLQPTRWRSEPFSPPRIGWAQALRARCLFVYFCPMSTSQIETVFIAGGISCRIITAQIQDNMVGKGVANLISGESCNCKNYLYDEFTLGLSISYVAELQIVVT